MTILQFKLRERDKSSRASPMEVATRTQLILVVFFYILEILKMIVFTNFFISNINSNMSSHLILNFIDVPFQLPEYKANWKGKAQLSCQALESI